ncbi:MAG: DUF4339 domain-containing protein [Bacteroidetes bacterium]|nr:DUF4339 domain-containing protein [Bacteroidota bacterium]
MKKYYIVEKGKKSGPFNLEELRMKNINLDTLIWFDGQQDWDKAKNIKELEIIIKTPNKRKRLFWFLIIAVIAILYLILTVEDESINSYENNEFEYQNTEIETPEIISNKYEKEQLQKLIEAIDYDNPITNDYAVKLASYFPGDYNIGQVCNIYDYIVKRWKYVNDSDKKENIRSASRSINNNLAGDCDDFAILIAAMIESIGGDARVSFAYNDEGGHAFTEVLATNSKEDMQLIVDEINYLYGTSSFRIYYYNDKKGRCWLNLDWFGEPQHPGGQYYKYDKRTIYYPSGNPPYFEFE